MIEEWLVEVKKLFVLLAALFLALPAVQAREADMDAYFAGSAFVGDSIMGQIGRFMMQQSAEGKAVFPGAKLIHAGAYSLYLASQLIPPEGSVALTFQGHRFSLADAVHRLDMSRVFILLGRCDNPGVPEHLERMMRYWTRIFDRIHQKSPDVEIIAISMPPVAEKYQTRYLRQEYIDRYNLAYEALCLEKDVIFCDISTSMKNAQGFMKLELSSPDGVHFSQAGILAFVDAINDFVRTQVARKP